MTQRGKTRRIRRTKFTENRGKTVNAKSLENLRPFPPGVSGNPGGRPAFRELSDACRAILSSQVRDGRTVAQVIAESLAHRAMHGSISAAAELADRAEGKAKQAVQVEGRNDRLEQLLEEFRFARRNPPPAPPPASSDAIEKDGEGESMH